MQLAVLEALGPPNSPPTVNLLIMRMTKQMQATTKNMKTEKPSSPDGTTYVPPAAITLSLS